MNTCRVPRSPQAQELAHLLRALTAGSLLLAVLALTPVPRASADGPITLLGAAAECFYDPLYYTPTLTLGWVFQDTTPGALITNLTFALDAPATSSGGYYLPGGSLQENLPIPPQLGVLGGSILANIAMVTTDTSGQPVFGWGAWTEHNLQVTDSAGNVAAIPDDSPGMLQAQFPITVFPDPSYCTPGSPPGGSVGGSSTATPTPSATPLPPTATPSATPRPPSATPSSTATPIPPTATPSATPRPPSATATPVPPSATPSSTITPLPPTATATAPPPAPTATPAPPSPTSEPAASATPPLPSSTPTLLPPSATVTPSPILTTPPAPTPSPLPATATASAIPFASTATPSTTATPVPLPSLTLTPAPSATPTATATPSATATPVPSTTPTVNPTGAITLTTALAACTYDPVSLAPTLTLGWVFQDTAPSALITHLTFSLDAPPTASGGLSLPGGTLEESVSASPGGAPGSLLVANVPLSTTDSSGQPISGWGAWTEHTLQVMDSAGNVVSIPDTAPGYAAAGFPLTVYPAVPYCVPGSPPGGTGGTPLPTATSTPAPGDTPTPTTTPPPAPTSVPPTATASATATPTMVSPATATLVPTSVPSGGSPPPVVAPPTPVIPPIPPLPGTTPPGPFCTVGCSSTGGGSLLVVIGKSGGTSTPIPSGSMGSRPAAPASRGAALSAGGPANQATASVTPASLAPAAPPPVAPGGHQQASPGTPSSGRKTTPTAGSAFTVVAAAAGTTPVVAPGQPAAGSRGVALVVRTHARTLAVNGTQVLQVSWLPGATVTTSVTAPDGRVYTLHTRTNSAGRATVTFTVPFYDPAVARRRLAAHGRGARLAVEVVVKAQRGTTWARDAGTFPLSAVQLRVTPRLTAPAVGATETLDVRYFPGAAMSVSFTAPDGRVYHLRGRTDSRGRAVLRFTVPAYNVRALRPPHAGAPTLSIVVQAKRGPAQATTRLAVGVRPALPGHAGGTTPASVPSGGAFGPARAYLRV